MLINAMITLRNSYERKNIDESLVGLLHNGMEMLHCDMLQQG
jgi:hypothetical protein